MIKIYMIERFTVNVLWKEIISCLWVYTKARLDVSEKSIIFISITLQNLVHKSSNVWHVTHLQVDHTSKNLDRLTPKIARYTIFLSDIKITNNSLFIVLTSVCHQLLWRQCQEPVCKYLICKQVFAANGYGVHQLQWRLKYRFDFF
jgi:hypothetical protein